jgi:hypothetical protein
MARNASGVGVPRAELPTVPAYWAPQERELQTGIVGYKATLMCTVRLFNPL